MIQINAQITPEYVILVADLNLNKDPTNPNPDKLFLICSLKWIKWK